MKFQYFKRFGCALVNNGQLNLKKKIYANDSNKIDDECKCYTCNTYSRSYLHMLLSGSDESTVASLVSIHNVAFQVIKNILNFKKIYI